MTKKQLIEMVRRVIREETSSNIASDDEIISHYKDLLGISKKNWRDSRIRLNAEMDTISKFSHSGNDTTHIKKLIRDLGLE